MGLGQPLSTGTPRPRSCNDQPAWPAITTCALAYTWLRAVRLSRYRTTRPRCSRSSRRSTCRRIRSRATRSNFYSLPESSLRRLFMCALLTPELLQAPIPQPRNYQERYRNA
eukprot:2794871-Pleurochrysis_carterae.AAC.1